VLLTDESLLLKLNARCLRVQLHEATMTTATYDLEDYVGPCIYLIRLYENTYKYGKTIDMPSRYKNHVREFSTWNVDGYDLNISITKLFRCITQTDMTVVETKLGQYTDEVGIKVEMCEQTEIIETDDIAAVCTVIENIIHTVTDLRVRDTQRLLERANRELSSTQCEIRQQELRYDMARLSISLPADPSNSMITHTMRDLSSVKKTPISGSYWTGRYMGYDVIGYGNAHINGTKLCLSIRANCKGRKWMDLGTTSELIRILVRRTGVPANAWTHVVNTGSMKLQGTYVHCMLIPALLRWTSTEHVALEILHM